MITYGYILLVVHILILGGSLQSNSGKELFTSTASFLVYLPLIGRAIGWW